MLKVINIPVILKTSFKLIYAVNSNTIILFYKKTVKLLILLKYFRLYNMIAEQPNVALNYLIWQSLN